MAALADGLVAACIDRAWEVSWERFYHPGTQLFYDYLSSYVPGQGLAHLPSAAEVARQDPNPYGYGTGMEDCMISAGVMLALLVDRYAVTRDDGLHASALAVLGGIRRCAGAAGAAGFMARGVCPENPQGSYNYSSRDQYTHAVHGLWHYLHSPLCTAATRRQVGDILAGVAERMTRHVIAANDYDSLGADGRRDPRGIGRMWNVKGHEAARLPMLYAAAWDATGNADYRARCRTYLGPAVEQSLVVEDSQPTYALLQMQASLELLLAVAPAAESAGQIREIMARLSARCAARASAADRTAQGLDLSLVGPDWRQSGGLVGEYRRVWYCIRESGEAALAQLLAGADAFPEAQQALLARAITRLDYRCVSSSGILYLQAAYWKARRCGIGR